MSFIFATSIDYCSGIIHKFFERPQTQPETDEYTEEFYALRETMENEKAQTEQTTESSSHSVPDTYRRATNAMSKFNDLSSKDFLLNLNAKICKTAGMSYIPGTAFIKLESGNLVFLSENDDDQKEIIEEQVIYIDTFVKALEDRGVEFLYVECPKKKRILKDEFPFGFKDTVDATRYQYMHKLFAEKRIPLLVLSDEIIKDDKYKAAMYYKTDHHWKGECGIDAAKSVSEYLNMWHGYAIDTQVFEKSKYTIDHYPSALCGSVGINATLSFTEAEDFDVFIPKDEGVYTIEIPTKGISLRGSFDVLIDHKRLDDKTKWPVNAYGAYIYANSAYVRIENESIDDDHKILIIKDSFANVVVPYLSQAIKRIDVIDLRKEQLDHYNSSVLSLIDENEYDMVLFMYQDLSDQFDRLYLK
ncbi:MAG: hypothetical protein E7467_06435 [Ruminococcaceae bacterium]|nr:hypothetical protein [Oscillospiraceae bacterium]